MKEKKEFKCPICGCNEHYEIAIVDTPKYENIYVPNKKGGGTWVESYHEPNAFISCELKTRELEGWIDFDIHSHVQAYLCKECSHITFFAPSLLKSIKWQEEADRKEREKINSKLVTFKNSRKESLEMIGSMSKRLEELEKLLSSEDITIRQQKEYKEEEQKLESEFKIIRKQLESLDKEIASLEQKL